MNGWAHMSNDKWSLLMNARERWNNMEKNERELKELQHEMHMLRDYTYAYMCCSFRTPKESQQPGSRGIMCTTDEIYD
jgi:hypothetical protein